ncbi:hypothetical protein C1H76_2283 [Elsinoe australis]|uniref:Uncharacterized protein n=1 Tax=Elsinoe australis TaxID=40998 RepID=A0A2P8A5Q3_9PEZI|nr:hypothetical protein B9Z65_4665 [Elsinoe australis]TKX25633.1 hypothetical protein C1H76_2283 [Elsinoe australis]
MKPVVGALNAWSCIVISLFAIIILSVIGSMFKNQHQAMVGKDEDPKPENTGAVSTSIFGAVFVYIGFLVFCGFQALLHYRDSRRGQIALS